MPANLDALLAPRRRAQQPTTFERRLGFSTHQRNADPAPSNRTRRIAPQRPSTWRPLPLSGQPASPWFSSNDSVEIAVARREAAIVRAHSLYGWED